MKIVTLTWNDDPFADAVEAFGDGLGSSPYWKSILGVRHRPRVERVPPALPRRELPATITDVQLDAMVQPSIANPASGWPANAPEQIYAVYLPPTTTFLVDNGDGTTTPACQLFGAYHTATQPTGPDGGPSGQSIIYSVMQRCPGFGIDTITLASAHEFGEAASDSYATGQPAYVGFDSDHLAYDIYQSFQDEIGDAWSRHSPREPWACSTSSCSRGTGSTTRRTRCRPSSASSEGRPGAGASRAQSAPLHQRYRSVTGCTDSIQRVPSAPCPMVSVGIRVA
jgi:hypothetical protein